MRTFIVFAVASMLLPPLAASATDLTLQLGGGVEYDNNAFRTTRDKEDDVFFRLRPALEIHEDRGSDLNYSLKYAVPFEFAVENSELDDVDQELQGDLTYRVNERVDFFVSNNFRYLRNPLREIGSTDSTTGTARINDGRERVTLNDARLGLSYRFSPRLSSNFTATHNYFDTDRADRQTNWLLSGVADVNYALTPKHTTGLGLRIAYQDFGDRDNIPGSQVLSYNLFASWSWRIAETTTFQVSVGPALIDTQQDAPASLLRVSAIPFFLAPPGFAEDANYLDPDGTDASGFIVPGSVVVSQLSACPTVETGSTTQVFPGTSICPIDPTVQSRRGILAEPGTLLFNAATMDTAATNPFASSNDDTRVDVFAQVVLTHQWAANLSSAVRYERAQGGASGVGGGVIRDAIGLSNNWQVTEKLQLVVRGDFVNRTSIADNQTSEFLEAIDRGLPGLGVVPAGAGNLLSVVGGSATEVDTFRWGVSGRATYRFLRNTSSWIQLTYNQQDSRGRSLGSTSDFENFLATLGVRHVFDPIKLW